MSEIPWWFCGWDPALALLRAWVRSLIWELRSHKPHGMTKKEKEKKNRCQMTSFSLIK